MEKENNIEFLPVTPTILPMNENTGSKDPTDMDIKKRMDNMIVTGDVN